MQQGTQKPSGLNSKRKVKNLQIPKLKSRHLEVDGVVTPDDLVKVKSGNGNVADAKTLGYLKKRKVGKQFKDNKNNTPY